MGETSFFERIDVVAQRRVWRAKIRVRGHRRQMLSGISLSIERIPMKPNGQKIFREYITDDDGAIVIPDIRVPELTREGVEVVVNHDISRLKRIVFRKDGERSVLLVSELSFTKEEMRYYSLL